MNNFIGDKYPGAVGPVEELASTGQFSYDDAWRMVTGQSPAEVAAETPADMINPAREISDRLIRNQENNVAWIMNAHRANKAAGLIRSPRSKPGSKQRNQANQAKKTPDQPLF